MSNENDAFLIEKSKNEVLDALDAISDMIIDGVEPKWASLDLEFFDSLKYSVDEIKHFWS